MKLSQSTLQVGLSCLTMALGKRPLVTESSTNKKDLTEVIHKNGAIHFHVSGLVALKGGWHRRYFTLEHFAGGLVDLSPQLRKQSIFKLLFLSNMITVKLCCGLGNRLFQMMAAIGEAERQGRQPVFFLPRMSGAHHGNFKLLRTLFSSLPILETAPEWEEVKEGEKALSDKKDTLIVLNGYFQNTDYFPEDNFYAPSLPLTPKEKDSWAIHFRFGDYQKLPHYHVNLSPYYYYTITRKIPKYSTVTLFSDSPDRLSPIQKELTELGYVVEIFDNPDVLETLIAFSACVKGSICSNSTFAWWAAWFAYTRQREPNTYKAYFPKQWIVGRAPFNLFNLHFTRSINLEEIPAEPRLLSFSHS